MEQDNTKKESYEKDEPQEEVSSQETSYQRKRDQIIAANYYSRVYGSAAEFSSRGGCSWVV